MSFFKGLAFGFLLAQKFWLSAIGGAFLCWLGVKTLL